MTEEIFKQLQAVAEKASFPLMITITTRKDSMTVVSPQFQTESIHSKDSMILGSIASQMGTINQFYSK